MRVFENRVLRGIFGAKRDEFRRKWRKMHNEELNDLYSSHSIVRVIKSKENELGGTCSAYGEWRCVCRVLVGKPEGKRPMGRPRCTWEDNIKMDLQQVGCGYME